MKLAEYLNKPDVTATSVAEACGCAVSTITRLAKGEISATQRMIRKIAEATDGAVQPADWFAEAA